VKQEGGGGLFFKFYLSGQKVSKGEGDEEELQNAHFKILILDDRMHEKHQVWTADFDIRSIKDQMKEVEMDIAATLNLFLENFTTPVLKPSSPRTTATATASESDDHCFLLLPVKLGPVKFDLRVPPLGYLEKHSLHSKDYTSAIFSLLDHTFNSPWQSQRPTTSLATTHNSATGGNGNETGKAGQSEQPTLDNDVHAKKDNVIRGETKERVVVVAKPSSTAPAPAPELSSDSKANKPRSLVGGAKIVSKKKRRR
jgi:hypothetical protein